jgi:thymidylate synthase (FAD)
MPTAEVVQVRDSGNLTVRDADTGAEYVCVSLVDAPSPPGTLGVRVQGWFVPQTALVREPVVRLIGLTYFSSGALPDEGPWEKWEAVRSESGLIEFAGRLCYLSFSNPANRTHEDYLRNLLQKQHFSVIEHVSASFLVHNVSRSVSHEFVRHRHFSFSQTSQRYVDPSKFRLVVPPAIRGDRELEWRLLEAWAEALVTAWRISESVKAEVPHGATPVARRKLVREAARAALPNCTSTSFVVTGNLRQWLHFLGLRCAPDADQEIREVALKIHTLLAALHPTIFEAEGPFEVEGAAVPALRIVHRA